MEKWENLKKKRESIFQSGEKSTNFAKMEKLGNFIQNTGKIRKEIHWKILKNTGKVGEICQTIIV